MIKREEDAKTIWLVRKFHVRTSVHARQSRLRKQQYPHHTRATPLICRVRCKTACTRMDGYDNVVILIMAIRGYLHRNPLDSVSTRSSKRLHGVVAGIGRNGKTTRRRVVMRANNRWHVTLPRTKSWYTAAYPTFCGMANRCSLLEFAPPYCYNGFDRVLRWTTRASARSTSQAR